MTAWASNQMVDLIRSAHRTPYVKDILSWRSAWIDQRRGIWQSFGQSFDVGVGVRLTLHSISKVCHA